jgi:hypothetical protein
MPAVPWLRRAVCTSSRWTIEATRHCCPDCIAAHVGLPSAVTPAAIIARPQVRMAASSSTLPGRGRARPLGMQAIQARHSIRMASPVPVRSPVSDQWRCRSALSAQIALSGADRALWRRNLCPATGVSPQRCGKRQPAVACRTTARISSSANIDFGPQLFRLVPLGLALLAARNCLVALRLTNARSWLSSSSPDRVRILRTVWSQSPVTDLPTPAP